MNTNLTSQLVFVDDDWNLTANLLKDGEAYDVSTATDISAAIVDSDGINPQTLIAAVTCSAVATGADWTNGVVIIDIPAASTGITTYGQAYIEIQATLAAKKITWPRIPIVIKKGAIA
jgi:hypothetical protein